MSIQFLEACMCLAKRYNIKYEVSNSSQSPEKTIQKLSNNITCQANKLCLNAILVRFF